MLKEIAESYPADAVGLHVVWLPMVEGDNKHAAAATGAMFPELVRQYYDAERVSGLAFQRDAFPACIQHALRATPEDHPLHELLAEWSKSGRADRPLWDAVLYFPKGVEWTDRAPTPSLWSKQVGFFGEDAGETTGIFFRNDCNRPPIESDWFREVRESTAAMMETERIEADGP